ncbi:hypothetical protein FG379_002646 [Cryptosporidium bovis]|uniref:uncharacterized protein n=1 Tax=Cryptosporidium bovis TaxID=310047 RepID=UPI00351A5222|nr:hypothetical protein FG379_002646 [Cryptosporidium bovis]
MNTSEVDDSSFWMPIIFKLAKPSSPMDYIIVITHSLFLDKGFIPLANTCEYSSSDNKGDKLNSASIPRLRLPIRNLEDNFSLDLMPTNWKTRTNQFSLFYTKCDLPPEDDGVDYFANASVKALFESLEDSLIITISNYDEVNHLSKISFPIKKIDQFVDNVSLKRFFFLEISNWMGNQILKCRVRSNGNYYNELEEDGIRRSGPIFSKNTEPSPFLEGVNIGGGAYFPDPLFDDKGIRGSLVGPNSAIFKGIGGKVKPKFIPTSSIPGMKATPDNDIYLPPGNRDFHGFY